MNGAEFICILVCICIYICVCSNSMPCICLVICIHVIYYILSLLHYYNVYVCTHVSRYIIDDIRIHYIPLTHMLSHMSHTEFVKDWDSKLIKMVESAPAAKPIISCYPPDSHENWQDSIGS